ncbi:MAG TPA: hypothetical protein VFE05_11755 [Longimicrobiaceae bacterium]|nr:hypothetical protein [Longimicrobiaceae bacterium]
MADQDGAQGRRDAGGAPRLTPYEMVFGEAGFESAIFPALLREADERGEDPARRERFAFLTVGSDALRDVIPADAPAEALEQHRALLYHSFNFWRFGRRLYTLEAPVARYLVEAAPTLADWDLAMPHPSVYVQLPPQLFWASISPDATPEPVDGFFAVETRGNDPLGPAYRELTALMVLGMRRERAGFSIIPFDTEVGPGIAADWAEAPGRDGARDFASVLPGGEMAGLYSILTSAEALKLLARALWYVDQNPDLVLAEHAPERRTHDRPGSIALSHLPYSRVVLDSAQAETIPDPAGDARQGGESGDAGQGISASPEAGSADARAAGGGSGDGGTVDGGTATGRSRGGGSDDTDSGDAGRADGADAGASPDVDEGR